MKWIGIRMRSATVNVGILQFRADYEGGFNPMYAPHAISLQKMI